MKILLTGGLGFIGKNFLLHRPKDWQVVSLDMIEDRNFQKIIKNAQFFGIDLTDDVKVKRLAQKMPSFDVCLHLAANSDPAASVPEPLWDLRSTTETLINICQNFKIKKLIYLSSGAVYDGWQGLVSPSVKLAPKLPYAISHLANEYYVQFFAKIIRIQEYVIIRFFGAYGPNEPPRKIYTNLVKAFRIEGKEEFVIRGDGKNFIDAMFVEDAIEAIVKVIESSKTNLTVDLCSGDRIKISDLVKQAGQIFGQKVKIVHQSSVPEYIEFYASPDEFERLFDFRAKISLKEGLTKLAGWIRSDKE
ncbi:MAG: NAD-dependent epimerase/dehydratase family protein [Patescibacteria group bacterium]